MSSSLLTSISFSQLERHTNALRRGYIVAISILAITVITNFVIIETMQSVQTRNLKSAEIATELQSDYQQIYKALNVVLRGVEQHSLNIKLVEQAQANLKVLSSNVAKNISQLTNIFSETPFFFPPPKSSKDILQKKPFSLVNRTEALLDGVNELSTIDPQQVAWRFSLWAPILIDLDGEGSLLAGINIVIQDMQRQSHVISRTMSWIFIATTCLTFFVLLLEVYFIFRPLLLRVIRSNDASKSHYEQLRYHATHDSLTRLGNRFHYSHLINSLELEALERTGLMLIDLDGFKNINDLIGHVAGDCVLETLGTRMAAWCQDDILAFRIGGDEFAILFQNYEENSNLDELAMRLKIEIEKAIPFENTHLYITAAIGIAPPDANLSRNAAQILIHADFAMRSAKKIGLGTIRSFNKDDLNLKASTDELAEQFKESLANNEIVPFYQPIVDLSSGEIIGLEALIRWTREGVAVKYPRDFLPIAEEYGMLNDMTNQLLSCVAKDRKKCLLAGFEPQIMSVNFPECVLVDRNMPDNVSQLLGTKNLHWLQIEVLETAVLHRATGIIHNNLRRLSDYGAVVALDDFGTGHASLTHLRNFPCHTLKIDYSFTRDLLVDDGTKLIIKGVIEIAKGIGLKVIAEGIELEKQNEFYKTWPGMQGQGRLFGMAEPIDNIIEKVKQNNIQFIGEKTYAN